MNKEQSNEPLGSKRSKKNGKGKTLRSYCGRGFHPESSCMRRKIDEMAFLLKKHSINVPASVRYNNKQHVPSSLIMDLTIISLHLENHSLLYNILMVLVFRWVITVKFEPKGRVLSRLNMESSNMYFMCPP